MPNSADGWYDRTKPWNAPPAWTYLRPWATNEERLTQQALDSALMPGADVTDMVRPNIEQSQPFRPRFGYRTRALGIDDVVNVDAIFAEPRNDYTGGPASIEGSSRPTNGSVW